MQNVLLTSVFECSLLTINYHLFQAMFSTCNIVTKRCAEQTIVTPFTHFPDVTAMAGIEHLNWGEIQMIQGDILCKYTDAVHKNILN